MSVGHPFIKLDVRYQQRALTTGSFASHRAWANKAFAAFQVSQQTGIAPPAVPAAADTGHKHVQVNFTFPRVLNGVRCQNDVLAFSGSGLCSAGSGKATGQRCSGVFQKNADETAACACSNNTDTIPSSTIRVERAIWTSLASQRTGQVN